MKKLLTMICALFLVVSLAACGTSTPEEEPTETTTTPVEENTERKIATVYFSWGGNTKQVAESIQSKVGGDLIEIVPEKAYSTDYDTVVDLGQQEKNSDARPAIKAIEGLDQYDTIFVGYPNWWGDMPMVLYTFFDTYDLSSKTIAPFATSSSSGLSGTVNAIKELEPNATVTDGLSIRESQLSDRSSMIDTWLGEIGLA